MEVSPEEVKNIDKSGILGQMEKFADDLRRGLELSEKVEIGSFRALIVCGMGGSAIAGDVVSDLVSEIPVLVNRDYELPSFVGEEWLLVAISYSGNTEETLSALSQAIKRECSIVCMTSGGLMEKLCERHGLPLIPLPKGYQPRAAFPIMLGALAGLLSGEVPRFAQSVRDSLGELDRYVESLKPHVPLSENPAKLLANELIGKVPIIYGARNMRSVAYRMRTQLNENAKMLAFHHVFPELDHNEIVGLSGGIFEGLKVVVLLDEGYPETIRTRVEAFKELFRDKVPITELVFRGSSEEARTLKAICLGDFASVYAAILRGIDPTPVEAIAFTKKYLKEKLDYLRKIGIS